MFHALLAGLVLGTTGSCVPPQAMTAADSPRLSVSYQEADIRDVVSAFAHFSGVKIVPGPDVRGAVTVSLENQPWGPALQSILALRQLRACADANGAITVEPIAPACPELPVQQNAEKASLQLTDAGVGDVLETLAKFSKHKIVIAPGTVIGTVTLDIKDQPWDVVLRRILTAQQLGATESSDGTITVVDCYRTP